MSRVVYLVMAGFIWSDDVPGDVQDAVVPAKGGGVTPGVRDQGPKAGGPGRNLRARRLSKVGLKQLIIVGCLEKVLEQPIKVG